MQLFQKQVVKKKNTGSAHPPRPSCKPHQVQDSTEKRLSINHLPMAMPSLKNPSKIGIFEESKTLKNRLDNASFPFSRGVLV